MCGDALGCGLCVLLLACPDHRGKNADALCALLNLVSKLVPRIQPGDTRSRRHLPCDLKDVAKGVAMKASHGGEIAGERFGMPGFKLLDKQLHVGGDDFFGGLRLGVE